MKSYLGIVLLGGLTVAGAAAAQTGNPVQDAINRDMMNRAIIRQATGGKDPPKRPAPAGARALFGRWVAMQETNKLPNFGNGRCALTEITFTPTTETRSFPAGYSYAAYSRKSNITYVNRDAHSFYVVPETTTVGPYVEIVDARHIRPEYADLCLYQKAG